MKDLPKAGAVLYIDRDASVQFSACPFVARMIRAQDWQVDRDGCVWLSVYELSSTGDALAQRTIYVSLAGLKPYVAASRGAS